MSHYSVLAVRIRKSRNGQPKVMNNTTARFDGDDIVVRHFSTDLFKLYPDGRREILCAYDSVTSKRRYWELGRIVVGRVMRGKAPNGVYAGNSMIPDLELSVPLPFERGTIVGDSPTGYQLYHAARYWMAEIAPRNGSDLRKRINGIIEYFERPYQVDGHDSGMCLVDPLTGCYVRLITEADRLNGVNIADETAIVDGKTFFIEPAEDYARGGRL